MPATQKRHRRKIRGSQETAAVTREQVSEAARRIKKRRKEEKDRGVRNGAQSGTAPPELKPSNGEA